MKHLLSFSLAIVAIFAQTACGGGQQTQVHLDIRPLQETKAFEIIEEILAERGYTHMKKIVLGLKIGTSFQSDYKVRDHKIAIEYMTEQDREAIGKIPPAAQGSRLHVLSARVMPGDDQSPPEQVFVFLIDDQNFLYHFNPTPDHRADVTVMEVDSRLRRDLQDFLSWYETTLDQR